MRYAFILFLSCNWDKIESCVRIKTRKTEETILLLINMTRKAGRH